MKKSMLSVNNKAWFVLLYFIFQYSNAQKKPIENEKIFLPENIITSLENVADWQLDNPTERTWNWWNYGPFYGGVIALYRSGGNEKYLDAMMDLGKEVQWKTRPQPYNANVLCIAQSFLELYEIKKEDYIIENTKYTIDATLGRNYVNADVTFTGNKYWLEWWSWCDALFMAPPAYARLSSITKESKYLDYMTENWKKTSDYLYSEKDSLYFRDDRFFTKKSDNEAKVFWSRGNGWVVGGLARVLEYMPKDYKERPFFEKQFVDMNKRILSLQMENGFWSQSLLDAENYPQKESSGTGFFVYSMAWGVNNGLLDKETYIPAITKGWIALNSSIHPNGKFGYVQEIGDSPTSVTFDDTELYGSGAYLLAGVEMYKLMGGKQAK
ncbi:glycoside hydrolase family 88/105 protein [Cellulophaga fucicola]|uniref:glycoside hydrolase family 88/105 protein n=1 Tax=Cellulophaga fucicola TaxID=76595 RepID=UPI003EC14AD2